MAAGDQDGGNGKTHPKTEDDNLLGPEMGAQEKELSKAKEKAGEAANSSRSVGASTSSTATEEILPRAHESWAAIVVPAAATERRTWLERHLVVSEDNSLRKLWNCYVLVLLLYTGTVLPFKIAFIESAVPDGKELPENVGMFNFIFLDIGFYIDLVVYFFFTFRDARGREVFSMKQIALKYLRTHFMLNLIACIPSGFVSFVACALVGDDGCISDTSANEVTRVGRLQRITRLARLVRLLRIAKFASYVTSSRLWAIMRSQRGMRIINSFGSLMFIIHLCASGWYLCASMHEDPAETWLNRRAITASGETILDLHDEYGPFQQWLTSMYFILTVFTTVGFGDMSAITVGEMIYVSGTMIIGCIVNGIILSEVITAITRTTAQEKAVEEKKKLLEDFAKHTQLDLRMTNKLTHALTTTRATYVSYSRESMKQLFTGSTLPRSLLTALPENLYNCQLQYHQFLTAASRLVGPLGLPPRFPLLVAIALETIAYDAGAIVYHAQDHAWNIYLVAEGTFAFIGKPDPSGGIANVPALTIEPVQAIAKELAAASTDTPKASSSGVNIAKQISAHVNITSGLTPSAVLNIPQALSGMTDTTTAVKGKLRRMLTKDAKNIEITPQDLSPYQLFGKYTYFGEVELVLNSLPRPTSCRCESQEGNLMVLHKRSLAELIEEFPRVAHSWRSAARRHEMKRRRLLSNLRSPHESHEHFAATTLSRYWRLYRSRGQMRELANRQALLEDVEYYNSHYGKASSTGHATAANGAATVVEDSSKRREEVPRYVMDLRADVEVMQVALKDLKTNMRAEVSKINTTLQGLRKLLDARQTRPVPDRLEGEKETLRNL